jgi:hypothetical protein
MKDSSWNPFDQIREANKSIHRCIDGGGLHVEDQRRSVTFSVNQIQTKFTIHLKLFLLESFRLLLFDRNLGIHSIRGWRLKVDGLTRQAIRELVSTFGNGIGDLFQILYRSNQLS